jgi:hypothetical protein
VESSSPRQDVEDLIRSVDQSADIPNSLRAGTAVKLNSLDILKA